jgi:pimeloyl-ACP methyl ester carboxylesterase
VDLLTSSGGHVVAHSYGANAALLAAQARPDLVRSLTLLEPACFDLARGMPAVEEHIAAMGAVFVSASDPGLSDPDWFAHFAAGMGFPPPTSWDDALSADAARLRRLSPPWGVGLRAEGRLPVRTLVLTAPSSPLYAETAESLVGLGAAHLTVDGAGHRVQDDPRTTGLLREHWRS